MTLTLKTCSWLDHLLVFHKEPPSDPQLTNCGHNFLIEGDNPPNPPCECRVTSLGSPAGRLVWRSGDAALLSGDYGVTQLRFPYEKMDRTRTGEAVKCQVDWVVSRNSTSFSLDIVCRLTGSDELVDWK